MTDVIVKLTNGEVIMGKAFGQHVHDTSIARGFRRKHGIKAENQRAVNRDAFLYEMAFAKMLDVYYVPGFDVFKEGGDVRGIEVRGTRWKTGSLIFRPGDDVPERPYALMNVYSDTETGMEFIYSGWCWGYETEELGKLTNFGHEDRPECLAVKPWALRKDVPEMRDDGHESQGRTKAA